MSVNDFKLNVVLESLKFRTKGMIINHAVHCLHSLVQPKPRKTCWLCPHHSNGKFQNQSSSLELLMLGWKHCRESEQNLEDESDLSCCTKVQVYLHHCPFFSFYNSIVTAVRKEAPHTDAYEHRIIMAIFKMVISARWIFKLGRNFQQTNNLMLLIHVNKTFFPQTDSLSIQFFLYLTKSL